MANHGLLAAGEDIQTTYNTALYIEEVADLYYHSRAIGTPVLPTGKEMDAARQRFKPYGGSTSSS